jgi:hypothetical protein
VRRVRWGWAAAREPGVVDPGRPSYTTKELSDTTWPDFEDLFSRGNGWDFCACMVFQRGTHLSSVDYPTRRDAAVRNRADKRDLVTAGGAHGILVYEATGRSAGASTDLERSCLPST